MQRRRFMVFDGTPTEYGERQRSGIKDFQERILAVWHVAADKAGEPDWIERLAQDREAELVFRYPRHNRYVCHAFFVKRLALWKDIDAHWERRKAAFVATGNNDGGASVPVWAVVSFFDRERFLACPPQAILTIDAVNSVVA